MKNVVRRILCLAVMGAVMIMQGGFTVFAEEAGESSSITGQNDIQEMGGSRGTTDPSGNQDVIAPSGSRNAPDPSGNQNTANASGSQNTDRAPMDTGQYLLCTIEQQRYSLQLLLHFGEWIQPLVCNWLYRLHEDIRRRTAAHICGAYGGRYLSGGRCFHCSFDIQ